MRKTQALGAAALVLVLGAGVTAGAYAEESARSGEALKAEAQAALNKSGAGSLADKYPGIDTYLNNLLAKDDGSSESTQALQEATEAVNLLKGARLDETSRPVAQEISVQNANRVSAPAASTIEEKEIAKVEKAPVAKEELQVVAANIAVQVGESAVAQTQSGAEEKAAVLEKNAKEQKPQENNTEAKSEEAVELPKTGEDAPTASVGQLILAGVAVMIMTVLGVAMVLKSKKNI